MDCVNFPTCQIGGYQVTALSDGTMEASLDVLSGIEPGNAERIQHAAGIEQCGHIHINCYLIRGYGRTILVDAGAGGQLRDKLKKLNIHSDDIDTILLTHGHPDHIGGLLDDNGERVYKKAQLHLHPREMTYWQDKEKEKKASERGKRNFRLARKVLAAWAGEITLFDENDIVPGIRPVWLPGHTPGHTGFHIYSAEKALLIWGDIVHFPHIQSAYPTVSILFDVDPAQAEETRKKVLQQAVSEKLIIAGMHLDQTGFSDFRLSERGYTCHTFHDV